MKKIFFAIVVGGIITAGCSKSPADNNPSTDDFLTLQQTVLTDFSNNVAVPQYKDLAKSADSLNIAIENLNTISSEENLGVAKQAWRNLRTTWEQCEGFLFGPVEDNNYDPDMDTWPVDYVQLDSLLTSNNPLQITDIQNLSTLSLRGFHPIEYILWGVTGSRSAASITPRQKQYMVSLTQDLVNNATALYNSWIETQGNFSTQVKTAGSGSTVYTKKQEVYLAIVESMIGICEEVGEGKIAEPFLASDSNIVESPFSGNTTIDFKNNIIGLGTVYLGDYRTQGKGITDLVAAKNIALDNKIKQQITTAINSFDAITEPFEQAIFDQRTQISNTQAALAVLKTTLEEELKPFIIQYITD